MRQRCIGRLGFVDFRKTEIENLHFAVTGDLDASSVANGPAASFGFAIHKFETVCEPLFESRKWRRYWRDSTKPELELHAEIAPRAPDLSRNLPAVL